MYFKYKYTVCMQERKDIPCKQETEKGCNDYINIRESRLQH